ncbi:MAG: hypothetical protein K0S12_1578 [Bacteroidetes bacterium]|nr:hypothetical protein [Bacteroidota bacterium]
MSFLSLQMSTFKKQIKGMKKLYTILLIFAAIVVTKSQTFQWARQYGSVGLDGGYAVTCDAGFAYTTGFFSGTTTFSATVPITVTAVNEDVYFAKIDSLGNAVWVQKFVSDQYERGTCITTDPSGNVLAAGFFHGTISCPVATLVGVGTSNFDIFITKLDNNGNFIWAKHLGNSVAQEAYTIKTDASGNVYVGGKFQGTLDFDPGPSTYTLAASGSSYDGFLMKLDPSGNFLWAVNAFSSTNDDGINAVAISASGNPYITGHYYTSSQKMYVEQRNSSTGASVWGALLGATTHTSYGTCMQFDASNNLIIGGYFRGTADFDFSSASYPLTSSGADDAFIMKFSATGTFSWAVRFGSSNGDRLFSLAVDPANNVWATGYFNNTVDFDPGTGYSPLAATTSTAPDVFLTGLMSNSNFIYAGKFGGTMDDVGNSIAVDGYKKIYTTGIFKMTADFDPSVNSYSLTSNNNGNIFMQQMSQCFAAPSLTSAISGSASICQNSTVGYSITPVNGANYYTWTLHHGK